MQFLATSDREKSVVITHHAPSIQSVATGKEADPIRAAYISNLETLIIERGPALWIHGHIHETRDYMIGATKIVNNASGYQSSQSLEKTGFRADLVVEL